MTADEFRAAISQLPYGKRLPEAIYIYWPAEGLPATLKTLVDSLRARVPVADSYNVVKFSSDFSITFLEYNDFFVLPHPALAKAIRVNLAVGQVKQLKYDVRSNPPILHRKELLLQPDHPERDRFAALTQQEEAAGLFASPQTIGFKANWDRLLDERGLSYDDHELVPVEPSAQPPANAQENVAVHRHRTAIARSELSKPVRQAMEFGILAEGKSVFDYGCGMGTDAAGLHALGFQVAAWDPAYFPNNPKQPADIVNLGYVLNVIEDAAERIAVLVDAWKYAREAIIVSTLVRGKESYAYVREHADGVLTNRNTFQKYFEPAEIQGLIESALEADAHPLAVGIYVVFRDARLAQAFLAARTRRHIDWEQLSGRLGQLRPEKKPKIVDLHERNKVLLDEFWTTVLRLGRVPVSGEFPRETELRKELGAAKKVHRLFLDHYGTEAFEAARRQRKEDLLVYLALANFRKRIPLKHLDDTLQADLVSHFGSYKLAMDEGIRLLMSLGDASALTAAASGLPFGWHDPVEGHYSVHGSLIERLPPLLRVFVECGAQLYGNATDADVVKIHLRSRKLTFLTYDDFASAPFPELLTRIKIDLPRLAVNIFEYADAAERQVLFFKERFLSADHPGRPRMEQISRRLEKLGIQKVSLGPNDQSAPTKEQFDAMLERNRLRPDLTKRRSPQSPEPK